MRLHILLFLALFDSRNYDYHIQASVCQATHQAFTCWASHRKYGLCTFKQVHPKQAHVEQVWECTWRVRPSGFELVHVEQVCVVPNEHIIKDGDPQCAPSMQTCSQQRCTSEYVDPLYVSTWQKDATTNGTTYTSICENTTWPKRTNPNQCLKVGSDPLFNL